MTAILTTDPAAEWQTMTEWPDLTLPVAGDRVVLVVYAGDVAGIEGWEIVASGTVAHFAPLTGRGTPLEPQRRSPDIDWSPTSECPTCAGRGTGTAPSTTGGYFRAGKVIRHGGIGGQMMTEVTCPDCNGTGTLPRYAVRLTDLASVEDRCPECWDTGTSEHGPTERETERGWVPADPRRACPTCWQQEITRVPPIPLTPPANRDAWEWTP